METRKSSTQNNNSVHFLVARLKKQISDSKDIKADLENILAETEEEWNRETEMRLAFELDNLVISERLKAKDDTISTLLEMLSYLTKENASLKALLKEPC